MFFFTLDIETSSDDTEIKSNNSQKPVWADQNRKDTDSQLEAALVELAKGNTDAIGVIYDLTHVALYSYILALLKNSHDAEDVTQDVYVKICQSAHMYSSQGKPMAWFYTIARNLALMKMRTNTRVTTMEDFEWEQLPADSENFGVEDKMVLSKAMSNLSNDEIEIIMMHVVGGLKHREIADINDIPLATVLSKYNRAIKKLQKLLS